MCDHQKGMIDYVRFPESLSVTICGREETKTAHSTDKVCS